MKYPKLLQKYDTIGICDTSSGASGKTFGIRLDNAIETAPVRCGQIDDLDKGDSEMFFYRKKVIV